MFNLEGISVILDYGHNKEGYRAVAEAIKGMKHKRLIGIIGVPGDRLDSDVLEVGKIAGETFDYIYIKEDDDKRGRATGEIAELLRIGAMNSGCISENNIEIAENERDALKKAIKNSSYGDIIMVFFEKYEPLLDIVKEKMEFISESLKVMA